MCVFVLESYISQCYTRGYDVSEFQTKSEKGKNEFPISNLIDENNEVKRVKLNNKQSMDGFRHLEKDWRQLGTVGHINYLFCQFYKCKGQMFH